MRVAELSRRSGVPVPTIKYYLREGLLSPGELTSPNQADYGETHLHRLALIRALGSIGGLPIAAIKDVLRAVDQPDLSLFDVLGSVQRGITTEPKPNAPEAQRLAARELFAELATRTGWRLPKDGPVYEQTIEVLAGLRTFGLFGTIEELELYARSAYQVAEQDVEVVLAMGQLDAVLEGVVAGTVLGETLFAGLRRMCHGAVTARRFDLPQQVSPADENSARP